MTDILSGNNKDTKVFHKPKGEIFDGSNYYIRLTNSSAVNKDVFKKLTQESILLGNICSINKGFHSGCDKVTKSNLAKAYPNGAPPSIRIGDGIFILNQTEFETIQPESSVTYPCYKNSDIDRYVSGKYQQLYCIHTNKNTKMESIPNVKKHLNKYRKFLELKREFQTGQLPWYSQHWPREFDVFANESKIVFPYRSRRNIFSFSDKCYFASEDVLYLKLLEEYKNQFHIFYLLGFLNSKLFYYWFYNKGHRKGNTLELYITPMTEVPIKKLSSTKQKAIIDIVKTILTKKKSYKETMKEEVAIDNLLYEFYEMTPEEVSVIEE